MKKFVEGDKVLFKTWNEMVEEYGQEDNSNKYSSINCRYKFTDNMRHLITDKEYTISKIYNSYIHLDKDIGSFFLSEDMFKFAFPSKEKEWNERRSNFEQSVLKRKEEKRLTREKEKLIYAVEERKRLEVVGHIMMLDYDRVSAINIKIDEGWRIREFFKNYCILEFVGKLNLN